MRTTLTLEDDVAARLEQMRKRKNISTKKIVDISLRAGLDRLEENDSKTASNYRLKSIKLGKKIPNLDNISDVLDLLGDE